MRCFFFSGTLALEGWFFYSFCFDNSKYELENDFEEKKIVIIKKAIVALFWFMSVLNLFRLFFGNPGFVSDYIKSEEITDVESGQSRFAIYTKADYAKK